MSILAGVELLGGVISAVKGAKDTKDVASELMDTYNKTHLIRTNGSMTKMLSAFIIEPVAIVSDDLKQEPNIDKILELNTDIFTSYFAQAFDVMTKVHGIDHKMALNLLKTDTITLGHESFDYTSDLFSSNEMLLSVEADDNYDRKRNDAKKDRKRKKKEDAEDEYTKRVNELNAQKQKRQEESEAEYTKRVNDINDKKQKLADDNAKAGNDFRGSKTTVDNKNLPSIIQRNVDLEILVANSAGLKHVIVIPMVIKLHIMYVKNSQIINMLDPSSTDKSWGNRLDDYRSGAISFSDLIFAGDLITKYKDNRINDDSGLTEMINQRTLSANAKVITEGGVGFEKFFNMLVLSNATKAMVEKHIKGPIKKSKYKEQLMKQANALLVTHVDSDYERVTIHTKDIRGTSDVTFKSLSKGSKDNDMSEIFKALVSNRPPVF